MPKASPPDMSNAVFSGGHTASANSHHFETFGCNPSFALEVSSAEGGTEQSEVKVTFSLTQSDIRGDENRDNFDLLCE